MTRTVKTIVAEAPTFTPDDETILCELAGLSCIEYDRRRKEVADALGIRIKTLDVEVDQRRTTSDEPGEQNERAEPFRKIVPWPEPVDGAWLLSAIADRIGQHVVLQNEAADAVALWVLHAHTHTAANISPLLAIQSPQKRCGKTTALEVVSALVPRALSTANITPASLFRAVEKWCPTLIIDEADTFLRNNDELRGIINSGHRLGGQVIRTVGDDHEPRVYRTWCPKAIALIGRLHDTLADRSIVVHLKRKRPDEQVERLRLDRREAMTDLARRAARWALDNLETLRDMDPSVPEALHDRAADNWRPLIAIADIVDGDWPRRARAAANALSGDSDNDSSVATTLLGDIRDLFQERDVDKLASADIVDALVEMEDRPWPEWSKGRPISLQGVARLLDPFDIKPRLLRNGKKVFRRYCLDDFEDAFSRYLPPLSVTPVTQLENNGVSEHLCVTPKDRVTDMNVENRNEHNGVTDVTHTQGGMDEISESDP